MNNLWQCIFPLLFICYFSSCKNNDFIFTHLIQHRAKKSKQFSGGERRLLEILLIVYSNAKYILLDEPFNGVAPIYKEEIMNVIRSQSKNKGFIITDHDYRNVLDVATRTVIIHDGGTKEIKDKNELKYLGYIPEIA